MTKITIRNAGKVLWTTLALAGMTTSAQADACMAPRDAAAMQTAAMQQRLMVAALSCQQAPLYNRFVTAYRDELQRSDHVLQHYFKRHGGISGYHAYKTKLANNASLNSLHDIRKYCADAQSVFAVALNDNHTSLNALLTKVSAPAMAPKSCGTHHTIMAERETR